jgi:hypothetical protein
MQRFFPLLRWFSMLFLLLLMLFMVVTFHVTLFLSLALYQTTIEKSFFLWINFQQISRRIYKFDISQRIPEINWVAFYKLCDKMWFVAWMGLGRIELCGINVLHDPICSKDKKWIRIYVGFTAYWKLIDNFYLFCQKKKNL